jgi:hypothetical protein
MVDSEFFVYILEQSNNMSSNGSSSTSLIHYTPAEVKLAPQRTQGNHLHACLLAHGDVARYSTRYARTSYTGVPLLDAIKLSRPQFFMSSAAAKLAYTANALSKGFRAYFFDRQITIRTR